MVNKVISRERESYREIYIYRKPTLKASQNSILNFTENNEICYVIKILFINIFSFGK